MSMNAMFRAALRRLFGRWRRNATDAELEAAMLRAVRAAIKRHYETGPHLPLLHDIMAVGLPKGHTVPVTDALNALNLMGKAMERVDRLPCFGGPLDGELLTDVEFYADGSFVGAVRTDADVRGGVYAWCRQSNRAVWTQDR